METPTMNMKNGKIRSVAVIPCQFACNNGAYTASHDPGSFTITIAAIVKPLSASKEINLCVDICFETDKSLISKN